MNLLLFLQKNKSTNPNYLSLKKKKKKGIVSLLVKDLNIATGDTPWLADAANCQCSLLYASLSLQHPLWNAVKTMEVERRYSEGQVTFSHTITQLNEQNYSFCNWKAVAQSDTWPFAHGTVHACNIIAPPIVGRNRAGGGGSFCLNSKQQENFSVSFWICITSGVTSDSEISQSLKRR